MQIPAKLAARLWLVVLAVITVWLYWVNASEVGRIDYVSGLAGGSEIAVDPESPTGYKDGLRVLLLPEGSEESYELLLQTGLMVETGSWRLRNVDYDNAPFGREITSPSLFRWWIGLLAGIDHLVSGRSMAISIEKAGLWGGPLVLLMLLAVTGHTVARSFGGLAASLTVLLLASVFPLAGLFQAGQPTAATLSLVFALWSVLPLVLQFGRPVQSKEGSAGATGSGKPASGPFLMAGIAGGLGLWSNATVQVPILIGVAASAALLFWIRGRHQSVAGSETQASNWRLWALSGALVSVAGYLIEFFPGHLSWINLSGNHPVYAIGWIGGAECLCRLENRLTGRPLFAGKAGLATFLLAVGSALLVPVLMVMNHDRGFLPFGSVLTALPGAPATENLLNWIAREGLTLTLAATLLPLILIPMSVIHFVAGPATRETRSAMVMAWGPAAIACLVAFFEPNWWPVCDVLLLPLMLASFVGARRASGSGIGIPVRAAVTLAATIPGIWILSANATHAGDEAVSEYELKSLIERNLSHWLARQAGPTGANVLAPPSLTLSIIFHGGLNGLSTPFPENQEGFAAAVRLAAATSPDEAKALAERRQLTHIIIPSWDDFLDELARIGATETEATLTAMLHRWLAPRWLAPVAYQLPVVEGFQDEYAAIFKTVEVQDNATALGRLAEYFLIMKQMDGAIAIGEVFERSFPGDLNALITRAQIAMAQRDRVAFGKAMDDLVPLVESGMGNYLPWDRRVSLAVLLAQFREALLTREQLEICMEEADDYSVRSLSTVSLFRLLSLMNAYDLQFEEPDLEPLALSLLPDEMREAL